MLEDLKKDTAARMRKCIDAVRETLKRLRTGRAQTSLLEHITVEYYGTRVPLSRSLRSQLERFAPGIS